MAIGRRGLLTSKIVKVVALSPLLLLAACSTDEPQYVYSVQGLQAKQTDSPAGRNYELCYGCVKYTNLNYANLTKTEIANENTTQEPYINKGAQDNESEPKQKSVVTQS